MPLGWAASAFAQVPPIQSPVMSAPPQTSISKGGINAVIDTINTGRNWFYGIIIGLVLLFILISAFNFMTAAGNDEKIKKAKKILKNSLIALVIAVISGGIILIITSFFDAISSSQSGVNPNNVFTSCVKPSDCPSGQTCLSDYCVDLTGDQCSDANPCPSGQTCVAEHCAVISQPPPLDCRSTGCLPNQFCDESRSGSGNWVCFTKFGNGEMCSNNEGCVSGYCNKQYRCAEKKQNGESCTTNDECSSNYCCTSANCAFTGELNVCTNQ